MKKPLIVPHGDSTLPACLKYIGSALFTMFFLSFSSCSLAQSWELAWSDEFNSTGYPNSNWKPDVWAPGTTNQELQAYTANPDNAYVSNGTLKIKATAVYNPTKGKNDYYSARLNSTASWTYGRFEARMKLPGGWGTWPAFWLYPDNEHYYGGTWPNGGEIDIMEQVGFDPNTIHASLHSACCNGANSKQRTATTTVSDPNNWHVYAAEWYPDHISFFVDGAHYFTYWNDNSGWQSWPYNHNYHVILNLAVGGSWGGQKGVDPNIWPRTVEVDYVRVYKQGSNVIHQLPGLVQAENFFVSSDVRSESTTDTDSGLNVGWIDTGDWMSYHANVPTAGSYKVSYRVASLNGGGILKLEKGGGSQSYGTVNIQSTGGWQNWTTVSHVVSLPAGQQDIGLVAVSGGFNINWFQVEPISISKTATIRMRGTSGQESVRLKVGGATVQTWTLSTTMTNYTVNTSLSGGILVEYTNDATNRDVQVDYLSVNGAIRQSEDQTYNTGVWQNGACGGGNGHSEWLHCNGAIGYGNL